MEAVSPSPDPVTVARRIARDRLAPAAAAVDREAALPNAQLDALARAGLYGLGVDDEFDTVCQVIEILAGACLTTTFVWTQHLGVLLAVVRRPAGDDLRARWLEPLRTADRRGGAAFTGAALPGPAKLHARPVTGGWRLDGVAPWVSGWGALDVLYVAGRDAQDRVIWGLLDAHGQPGLTVRRLDLLAIDASTTVEASFDGVLLPADRVMAVAPVRRDAINPAAIRTHAALVLGVAGRCCELLGPSPIDDRLAADREALDAAVEDPAAMVAARAGVSATALQASAALLVSAGANGVRSGSDSERLAREALFLSVFGSRAPIRANLLDRLGAGR